MANRDDQYHRQAQVETWAHLLGYEIIDQAGEKIGTVKALWEDYTRQPAYLGVATSWLDMGRIHVVPAQFFSLSEKRKCLRLPFAADVVKGAPECHAEDEITLSGETKIRDYFYRKGIGAGAVGPASGAGERPESRGDWSPRGRQDEDNPRGFQERIRDSVDEGKARLGGSRADTTPEGYGLPEREMGLPFTDADTPHPLRKITGETPVAEPVQPRPQHETGYRDEDGFVPLRGPDAGPGTPMDSRGDQPLR